MAFFIRMMAGHIKSGTGNLLIPPEQFTNRIADFNFQYLAFEHRKLAAGEVFRCDTRAR